MKEGYKTSEFIFVSVVFLYVFLILLDIFPIINMVIGAVLIAVTTIVYVHYRSRLKEDPIYEQEELIKLVVSIIYKMANDGDFDNIEIDFDAEWMRDLQDQLFIAANESDDTKEEDDDDNDDELYE